MLWRARRADASAVLWVRSKQRRFSVALFHGTQTLENMRASRRGVMQILGVQHAGVLTLLGKTRGQDVDKARAV